MSEVREELNSVLSSARFRQSPRLTKLLRYICGNALIGEAAQITEYTIAVDVLGKAEDFKEGKDSIVRVEVHRLRKRLVEFYEEEGAAHRVRIAIPTGSYAPQFVLQDEPLTESPAVLVSEPVPSPPVANRAWPKRVWAAGFGLIVMAAILPAYQYFQTREQPLDAFWDPVLSSSNAILLCVGDLGGGTVQPQPEPGDEHGALTLKEMHSAKSQTVHFADAATLARIAGMIQAKGKRYRIVPQSEATYADLRNSPVVLIGLLNNDWTKRLVGNLRFLVERPGGGIVMIRDRDNPSRRDWFIDYYRPFLDVSRDYALVVRTTDPKTEQMTVMAAGLSAFGTLAAGEFLANRNEMGKLEAAAPKGWRRKNLEIVLSTDVIRGNPGPPAVVATHFW